MTIRSGATVADREPARIGRRRRATRTGRWTDALAWAGCAAVVALVAGAVATGRAGMLNKAYPVLCVTVGVFLYAFRPMLYVGFAWWLWLLSPFVRRLTDYQSGWTPLSPVLATSLAVTSISLFSLLRFAPRLRDRRVAPMAAFMLVLLMGYVIGVLKWGLTPATYDLAQWLTPVALGFHLAGHWRLYPEYRRVVERVFVWGVLVTGGYGLLQFFAPPPWDAYWMLNVKMASIGLPLPMQVRVFSTLNAPGPFATFMMGGLLLVLGSSHSIRLPATLVGHLGFLLSLVRSAWLAWLPGVFILLARLTHRRRLHVLVGALVTAVAMVPVVSLESIAEPINERVASLGSPAQDESLRARVKFAERIGGELTEEPLGSGLGATAGDKFVQGTTQIFDNGVLHLFYVFGWVGGLVLVLSTCAMIAAAWTVPKERVSGVEGSSAAIVLSSGVLLLSGPSLLGVGGLLFWTFAGLNLAARRHRRLMSLEGR
jgi:hypothetical protein